jgi:hypothetical protein
MNDRDLFPSPLNETPSETGGRIGPAAGALHMKPTHYLGNSAHLTTTHRIRRSILKVPASRSFDRRRQVSNIFPPDPGADLGGEMGPKVEFNSTPYFHFGHPGGGRKRQLTSIGHLHNEM